MRQEVVMSLLVARRAWMSLAILGERPLVRASAPLVRASAPLCVPRRFCRVPSPCLTYLAGPEKRPCFNMNNLLVMRASNVHEKMIRSFLFTHYWPREPSITALWMSACSKYVDVLNDKYASFGFRYIAFEKLRRTNELKMVGVLVGNKVFPWSAEELEQWTLLTDSPPEQTHMFFRAHVLRSSNLFAAYNCSYVYELEVLATAGEVMGLGVGTELVKFALNDAYDQRIPVTSLVATSHYAAKICKKVGMTRVWSCDYRDMVDHKGNPVFFPRAPHTSVSVYAIRTEKRL